MPRILMLFVATFLIQASGLALAGSGDLNQSALDAVNDALSASHYPDSPSETPLSANSSGSYSPYLGKWAVFNEEQGAEAEDILTFTEKNDRLVGRPNTPDLPVLWLGIGDDGVLRGEAVKDSERIPVSLDRVGSGKKLFMTFAPPESEFVHAVAVKKE